MITINRFMHKYHRYQFGRLTLLAGLILVGILMAAGLGFASVRKALAQLESDVWTEPVNLSLSGSTSNPEIVVDNTGNVHVVWLDGFSGTIHRRFTDGEWTPPELFLAPFQDIIPLFVSDETGYVHAFWIDATFNLMHSRIDATSFGNLNAWSTATELDQDVIKFNIAVSSENHLHVAYVHNVDDVNREAGIYYRNSLTGGVTWSQSELLYPSSYLRMSDATTANIHVASNIVGDIEYVFVAWDERSRKRIYLARSSDGGETWAEPLEVDKPSTISPLAVPQNVLVASKDDDVILFWEDGNRDEFSCRFYYQFSSDNGESWSNRNAIEIGLLGCLDDSQIMLLDDGNILLIGQIQNQFTFLVWNGESWSEPQPQESWNRFINQDTLTPITLGCINFANAHSILYLVGCDLGSSGDIWTSTFGLQSTDSWFGSQLDWSKPALIQQSPEGIGYPSVVVDAVGDVHILWSELEVNADNSTTSRLGYAAKNGSDWSQPIFVSKSIEGNVAQIDSIVDTDENILVTWSGGSYGDIYLVEANLQEAGKLNEWTQPELISIEKSIGLSPVIQADQEGVVYIAYGVALNEGRGVYLSKFDRETRELEGPSLVYDASLDGYELVNDISFARDARGQLFITWIQKPIEPDIVAGGDLYFTTSTDNGLTWSSASKLGYDNVVWSHVVVQDDQAVHLFYQEVARVGFYGLKHMYSIDDGVSWSTPTDVLSHIGESPGYIIPVFDNNTGLYLMRAYTDERSKKIILQQLRWIDQNWVFESSASFPVYNNDEIIGIDGWATADKLVFVYAVKEQQYLTAPPNYFVYSTDRSLNTSGTSSDPTPGRSPRIPSLDATDTPGIAQSTEVGTSLDETPSPVPSSDLAEVLNPEPTLTATSQPGGSRLPGILGNYGVVLAIGVAAAAIIGIVIWMRKRNLGRGK